MLRKISVSALIAIQALMPAYAQSAEYYFRYNKTVVTGDSTTTPPANPTGSKHSIPDVTLAALNGNVNGPSVASVSPKTALAAIASQIDGGVGSVVYDSETPVLPGLAFNATSGTVSGVPSGVYAGTAVISYHDTSDNVGKINLPVAFYPQPALVSSLDVYTLPRLAQAASYDIGVTPANDAFYAGVSYALAPGSAALPVGLTLSNGQVVGSTQVAADTSYKITIRATSNANAAVYADKSLTINIVGDQAMTLALSPKALTWQMDGTGAVTYRQPFSPAPGPKGTYVNPVTWSVSNGPAWLTAGSDGQLGGTPPSLGSYVATVQAKDAQQTTATDTVSVNVIASGYVMLSPGVQQLNVRTNEAWATAVQTASETETSQPYAGGYTFSGENVPSGVTLDTTTGVSSGDFSTVTSLLWRLHVRDELGRTDGDGKIANSNYIQIVTSYPPVTLAAGTASSGGALQLSPLSVSWPKAANVLGNARYTLVGAVPGSLYYKDYDNNDASQLATYTPASGTGAVRQAVGETAAQTEARLPADHIVLDRLALTLKGIPSQSGTFSVALAVYDDHQDTGYTVDPSYSGKAADNSATSPSTSFTVQPGAAVSLSVSPTSNPSVTLGEPVSVTISAANTAYGATLADSSWVITGTLPDGVTPTYNGNSLTLSGTPTAIGSYTGINVAVTDAVGNTDSKTLSFTVTAATFAAVNSDTSQTLLQYADDATITTTLVNATTHALYANGATWTLASGTLPPGIVADISDDTSTLSYDGDIDDVGTWSNITWNVTDAAGTTITTSPVSFKSTFNPNLTITAAGGPVHSSRVAAAFSWTLVAHNVTSGGTIDPSAWKVTGDLPDNVTWSANGNSITFVGTPHVIATLSGITVSAVDPVGKPASLPITFKVTPYAPYHTINTGNYATIKAWTGTTASTYIILTDAYFESYTKQVYWNLAPNSGPLPPGMSFRQNAIGNTLNFVGPATQEGVYPGIYFWITDSDGHRASSIPVTITVTPRDDIQLTASPDTYVSSLAGSTAAITLTATHVAGGTLDPSEWSISGNLPDGVSATVSGNTMKVSGKPVIVGHYPDIAVTANDGNEQTTQVLTFDVTGTFYANNDAGDNQNLAAYTDQASASTTLHLTSNDNVYTASAATWTLLSGTIPPGIKATLSSDKSSMVYSGSPTAVGTYSNIVWQVVDTKGVVLNTNPMTFTVGARANLSVSASAASSNLTVGTAATVTATASNVAGGTLPSGGWTYTGTPPNGMNVTASGNVFTVSGTPTAIGPFSVTATATDAQSGQGSTTLSFTVAGAPAPFGSLNFNAGKETLAAFTSNGAKYLATELLDAKSGALYVKGSTWVLAAGSLPPGMSQSVTDDTSTLYYVGYPTATGVYKPVWRVTDSLGNQILTDAVTLTVGARAALALNPSLASVSLNVGDTASNTVGAINVAYGSLDPSAWTISGAVPPGLSASVTGNVLKFSGQATTVGTYVATISAIDSQGGQAGTTVTFTVGGGAVAVNSSNAESIAASTAQPTIKTTLNKSTGGGLYTAGATWNMVSGTLPPGVTPSFSTDKSTLTYVGYPTTEGSYANIVWNVTDASGNTFSTTPVTFTVTPRAALAFNVSPGTTVSGKQGYALTATVTPANAANGTAIPASSWTVSGTLPAGVTYAVVNGVMTFSGTPTVVGDFPNVVVSATDSLGSFQTTTLDFNVSAGVTFWYYTGLDMSVQAWTGQLGNAINARSAGNNQYTGGGTYSLVSGTLPAGLSIQTTANASFMNFTGYATTPGVYSGIVVELTDPSGANTISSPFSITVTPRSDLVLTPSTTTVAANVGDTVSATVTATNVANGTLSAAEWTVTGLPTGVTPTASGNVMTLSGKPTAAGNYTVAVKATDDGGETQTSTIAFNVTANFVATNTTNTQAISQYTSQATVVTTLTNSGALYTAGATWTLASGTVPPGVTYSLSSDKSTLTYTGYPTASGSYPNIVWNVTNASGTQITTPALTFTVGARAALSLAPATGSTLNGRSGNTFSAAVTPSNPAYGTAIPASGWSVTGTLPDGITPTVSGGILTFAGTPTASGTFANVVVTATDSAGGQASTTLTFSIASAVSFSYGGGGLAQSAAQYTGQFAGYIRAATSGNVLYTGGGTYAVVSGALPPGIALAQASDANNAYFTGYPTATGTYGPVVFSLTDPNGNVTTSSGFTFTVTARAALSLAVSPGTSRTIAARTDDAGVTVTASNVAGGTLAASNWTVTGLPPGVSYALSGTSIVLSGKATAAGTYTTNIGVTDSQSGSASTAVTFTVTSPFALTQTGSSTQTVNQWLGQPTVSFSPTNPADGSAYTSSMTFALASGTLPPGVTATVTSNPTKLAFTGYPTTVGTWSGVTYTATDAAGNQLTTAAVNFTVTARAKAMTFSVSPTVNRQIAVNVDDAGVTVTPLNPAKGGPLVAANYTVSNTLPPGVTWSVNAAGALVFAGKATTASTYTVTVAATDAGGSTANTSIKFVVSTVTPYYVFYNLYNAVSVASEDVPEFTGPVNGDVYAVTYSHKSSGNGAAVAVTWSLVSGSLPPGMSWTPCSDNTCVNYSGAPTATGNYPFTLMGVDSSGVQVFGNMTFNVVARQPIAVFPVTATVVGGTAYTTAAPAFTVAATYGVGTVTFSATGLPPGLSINSSTGVVTGTITKDATIGVNRPVFTVTDSVDGTSNSTAGNITVLAPFNYTGGVGYSAQYKLNTAGTVTAYGLSTSVTGAAYASTLTVSTVAGSIPPGMNAVMNGTNVQFTGTPTQVGTWTATLKVTDANGWSLVLPTAYLSVSPTTGVVITTPGTMAYTGAAVSTATAPLRTMASTGGTGTVTWTQTGLPAGFTMTSAGLIYGQSLDGSLEGTYPEITVTATDSVGNTDTKSFAMSIVAPFYTNSGTPAFTATKGTFFSNVWNMRGPGNAAYTNMGMSAGLYSGTLPPGLYTYSTTREFVYLAGTPTKSGTYTFTLKVTDMNGFWTTVSGSMTVN